MTAEQPTEAGALPLSVAGIGASAGGLAATTELLQHLGPRPGLAAVIVHHLDPNYESSLVEIISRITTLPVRTAVAGLRVEANQIYVVPQNAILSIEGGVLSVEPRDDKSGRHLPIDRFFEALAADRTVRALGVVLTGSGSDGTTGISAIKANGGITFAQDGSAEYGSMPESAIATGCVDFILPPARIAEELVRIGQSGATLTPASGDEQAFRRIFSALRETSAIDFANYKQSTFRRRVERRIVLHALPNLSAYADLVERSREESRALTDEVLIHVTSFFRDPETFDVLGTAVFPKLLENRPRDAPFRIWVPGCSTGEEVYSIAIALLEFLSDANAGDLPIKVFGTDVSSAAIEKARAAQYPASIEHDVGRGRLQRFFTSREGLYEIRKDVRDLCIFAKQDATRDPPFAGMDLISCRNLMIYLGTPLQDRILPIFHYALKEPGFLVLGSAETVRAFPGFSPLDAKNRIYARTSAAPRVLLDFGDRRSTDPTSQESAAKMSVPPDVNREVDRLVLAEFAPPGVVVTDNLAIVQFRGRTGPFLEPAAGVASFDLLRMARDELRLPLRQIIDEARAKQAVTRRAVPAAGPGRRALELEVIPFRLPANPQRYFVVLFREAPSAPEEAAPAPAPPPAPGPEESQLAQELASTRDYLQSVIEQLEASNEELRAANEEIVSSNEELRSTNEELQMAKEELQATNEELRTLNDEMAVRNQEATRLNDDLTNVLASAAIPIVILGRDSRVRRFTPAAAKLFLLKPGDVGRPIGDLEPVFPEAALDRSIAQVLQSFAPLEQTVQDREGRWCQLTVLPYVTLDNRIDGAVVTAVDIDTVKKAERLLTESRQYAESIIDTMREGLVVLARDGRVRSANPAFLKMIGVAANDVESRMLYDLGQGEWNIPELWQRLRELGAGGSFDGYRIEQELAGGARRVAVLNARRIEPTDWTLLVIDDVTERERAARTAQQAELGLREMLASASGALLTIDDGPLVHAGPGAAEISDFSSDETSGLRMDRLTRTVRRYQDRLRQTAFASAVAEERERRRIAVEVHDHIGQSLALAQIKLTGIRGAITDASRATFDQALDLLRRSIVDTRTLIFELNPPILYDLGLKEALSWLVEDLEKRFGLRIELTDDGQDKPLGDTTALVFRAVRELLANIFKHAQATSAKVALRRTDHHYDIEVEDQGVGFDPQEVDRRTHNGGAGFGLFSLREQIGRLGGTVDVASAPGRGTRVNLRVPIKPGDPP